jgi:DNA-binding response OmpR family regulator
MKVVLVDDTPEIAELLTFALRDRGYEVFASGFTGEINALLDEQQADALVLDCTAYEMSESIFDSVRASDQRATLPIVIVSDTPEHADASLRSRHAQHVLLIPKPFTGSQIARALDQLLHAE